MDIKRKTKVKSVLYTLWKIVRFVVTTIILFISIIIVMQRVSNDSNAFLGFRIYRVETGSMIPKYNIGDVIFVKSKPIEDIKEYEDLVYLGESGDTKGKIITHQVIKKENVEGATIFRTKGIANTKEDAAVNSNQVKGVVLSKLYVITFICQLFNNKYIFYFVFIVPITIYLFFITIRSKKEKIKDKRGEK